VVAVTVDRGKRAPRWVAAFLEPWFPHAEATPNSRPGRDILGTPGMAFEVKTCKEWRPGAWVKQAAGYAGPGELAVLVYLPPGMGAARAGDAMAIMPLRALMPLAAACGFAPARTEGGG
jgi:hypothetical protein